MSIFGEKRHLMPSPFSNFGQQMREDSERIARDIEEFAKERADYQAERDQVQDGTLAALQKLSALQEASEARQEQHEKNRADDAKDAKTREWWLIGIASATLVVTVTGVLVSIFLLSG